MYFTVMYRLVAAIPLGNGVGGRMATAPHYSTVWYYKFGKLLPTDSSINRLNDEH
jgi:hypothetical protein